MRAFLIAAASIAVAGPAAAQQPQAEAKPQAFVQVIDCRAVQGDAERLACYDRTVSALQAAEAQRQLVVVDRQQVQRTRRSIFGFVLPDLDIFGSHDGEDPEAITELNSTLRGVTQNGNGRWVLTLDDGARWVQMDSRQLPRDPRSGHGIKIRRAAMGSYLANIDGQVAIRVRRER